MHDKWIRDLVALNLNKSKSVKKNSLCFIVQAPSNFVIMMEFEFFRGFLLSIWFGHKSLPNRDIVIIEHPSSKSSRFRYLRCISKFCKLNLKASFSLLFFWIVYFAYILIDSKTLRNSISNFIIFINDIQSASNKTITRCLWSVWDFFGKNQWKKRLKRKQDVVKKK